MTRAIPRSIGLFALAAAVACGPAPPPPNVLLITIDTLRADYVRAYGFPSAITPQIDALAARGVLFENAVAASSSTVPSHASIMTGLYGQQHSVGLFNGPTRLEGAVTLAERFREAGYATGAFIGNVVLKRRMGLDHGFDHYDDELPESEPHRPALFERIAEASAERALAWLDGLEGAPFLLWMHYQDPHGPYTPPPPYDGLDLSPPLRTNRPLSFLKVDRARAGIPAYQRLGDLRRPSEYASRYAGEIAYVDGWVGRLVEAVEARSGERDNVILLTADHGESLGEGGFFFQHGHATTPELAQVPFILVAPELPPAGRSQAVSHVDVAPTLLDLAGLPPLPEAKGVSLVPLAKRARPIRERVVYCETPEETSAYTADSYVRVRGWQRSGLAPVDVARADERGEVLWSRHERLANGGWRSAPGEIKRRGEILAHLANPVMPVPADPMSEEDVARLRALGYLASPDEGEPTGEDASGP